MLGRKTNQSIMMLNETPPAGIASLLYLHHESDEVASLSWPPKQPCTIDVEGLYREVRSFCAKGLTPEQRARADFLQKIKP